jgi:TPR repeat protein
VDKGDEHAAYQLAYLYDAGSGVPQDHAEAVRLMRFAADKGMPAAMNNVGIAYFRGMGGVAKDSAEAGRWYLKAAQAGDGPAMMNLAGLYMVGEGVPKDEAEGMKWLRAAAAKGFKPAIEELAKRTRSQP